MFDKILKIVYTLCNGGVCVEENTSRAVVAYEGAYRGISDLRFLYKKCKKIKPYTITAILRIPQFVDALSKHSGFIDDEVVYEVLRERYIQMMDDGKSFRPATNVLNQVSLAVVGDKSAWRK